MPTLVISVTLAPPVLVIYYRTRLLERFATDRPGVMGCLYRHVGDDAQGVRWEVVESWIGEKRMVHEWRQMEINASFTEFQNSGML